MGIRVSEFQNKQDQRSKELLLIYIHRGQIWPRGREISYCYGVTEQVTNPIPY